ncbi:hypothetical protein KNE206_60910 [Kitasatospora sp. NE20-6]
MEAPEEGRVVRHRLNVPGTAGPLTAPAPGTRRSTAARPHGCSVDPVVRAVCGRGCGSPSSSNRSRAAAPAVAVEINVTSVAVPASALSPDGVNLPTLKLN